MLFRSLNEAVKAATTQDDLVIWFFKAYNSGFTPSQVWQNLIMLGKIDRLTPLTSIRRSISSLTDANILEMTKEQKKGVYGRREHVWRLYVHVVSGQLTMFE